jgi:hypothetical protein
MYYRLWVAMGFADRSAVSKVSLHVDSRLSGPASHGMQGMRGRQRVFHANA